MPSATKTVRKPAKKTVKKAPRRSATRTLSASHKRALIEGRTMSATIDRYLAAVNTPKRRGRKVSQATLVERLGAAQARVKTASGVDRVLAAQEVRDLTARIAAMTSGDGNELKELEADVRAYRQGIRREAWDRLRRLA